MVYPDLYGAFDIAREYCGFSEFPNPKPTTDRLMWQHGVICWDITFPEQGFGAPIPSVKTKKLLANKWLLDFYNKNSIPNAYAIGLPVVYLPEFNIRREENSLLVFPGHGVPNSESDNECHVEYANYIKKISKKFKKVEVSIFGPDIDRGSSVYKIFKNSGLDIMRGVEDSKQTLHLQKKRLLSYSHVTSNIMGSHIAYAGSCGCKVSIAGPIHEYKKEHLENTEFCKLFPQALDMLSKYSENSLRKHFPWLFCEPHKAQTCENWGNEQIGVDYRLTPIELSNLFGWSFTNILKSDIKLSEKIKYIFRYARN